MEKIKNYYQIKFSADVIQEAFQLFMKKAKKKTDEKCFNILKTTTNCETWDFDNFEEFFSEIRKKPHEYNMVSMVGKFKFELSFLLERSRVGIKGPSRQFIETIFDVFERNLTGSRIESPNREKRPIIFIGHGRNQQWRDIKDHLHEQHGYQVEAYEIGARAGHTIRDILENMMEESTFAILIFTGEDEDNNGIFHPRLNVVHELGLFQGCLGFSKAIALVEEGTEEFSNIHGIQQIRFTQGKIRETYGDVLATIRREFEEE